MCSGAAPCAITNVIAHEIGDDGCVTRIVLWYFLLHFTDQVGADVG